MLLLLFFFLFIFLFHLFWATLVGFFASSNFTLDLQSATSFSCFSLSFAAYCCKVEFHRYLSYSTSHQLFCHISDRDYRVCGSDLGVDFWKELEEYRRWPFEGIRVLLASLGWSLILHFPNMEYFIHICHFINFKLLSPRHCLPLLRALLGKFCKIDRDFWVFCYVLLCTCAQRRY